MTRLPTLFVSHGAPTWALEPGKAGALLAQFGQALPRPEAILVVSPHWITQGVAVSSDPRPRTLHDFGGFPEALYRLQYPAPGSPVHAIVAAGLLTAAGFPTRLVESRGLDHGAWVPLRHLHPAADVPVFQVSMPHGLDADGAWRMGEALAPLAERNVLVVGSGSLTHNLRDFQFSDIGDANYAQAFVDWVRAAVTEGDDARLRQALERAPHAARAHPTDEHYLPLLVAAAAAGKGAPARVLEGGMAYGVISMEAYTFGVTASEPLREKELAS